jgi:aspartate/methionine/tyrosine aminotransferase
MRTPPKIPSRMRVVQDPVIPIVGEWTRDNPGTISLGQGVVSWGPPAEVYDAVAAFREDPGNQKYKLVQGIPPLLECIEGKLSSDNGIRVSAQDRIVVTAGANMGFMNAVLAITDPGDEIILPAPYYFNHEMAVRIAGCIPRVVPNDAEHQLQPGLLADAINEQTRAIVTISPNNPSGAVHPEADLTRVNQICREKGIYHITDEAYEYFTYDGTQHFSPSSINDSHDHTISLFSLSKSYGFASWRIGYMVIPEHLMIAVKKIQDTNLICPPVISQYAAVAALNVGPRSFATGLSSLAEVRGKCIAMLDELGEQATCSTANGALYFLLNVKSRKKPMELVRQLVEQYKVAVMPGTAFGLEDGCYIRLSYGALSPENVLKGIGRLVEGLQALTD